MKLRIANYYDNRITGRNDGNPLYMYQAFKRMEGIQSDHLIPTGDLALFGTYDLHFEADWAEDALKPMIPYEIAQIPHPSAFWASDTHLGYDWRLEHSRKFDHVFVAQKRALEEFKRDGVDAIWLPHAAEPLAYPNTPSIKKYDLCFIGHVNDPNRLDALDRMFREFPNFFYGVRRFEEAAEKYCQSKIVFNIAMRDDINMRVFETLCSGSFLLTNWLPTLGDLFEDGKHLVTYKTLDEAVEKAKYYIAHDDEREKIAEAGFQEVRSKHTFAHRAKTVLDACLPGWETQIKQKELVNAGL